MLDMLKKRNEIVHEYKDFSRVDQWCRKITEEYIPLLSSFCKYSQRIIDESNQKF